TCVNEALSKPKTRVSSSVVMCRASSNWTGRGSRYKPVSCFVSERLSSVRSSRLMFWATSEMVYSGIVSRNTSASPRQRSRSSRHGAEDQVAIRRGAGDQDVAIRRAFGQRSYEFQRLVRTAIEGDEADVRIGLANYIAKEFVARALGFEPHGIETEQHRLEFF